jgi:hypothetical protein
MGGGKFPTKIIIIFGKSIKKALSGIFTVFVS